MEQKIAILTDIHGNHSALKAVLDEIDRNKETTHIHCLGDLIGIGHETNEVLDLLFSRQDISFVIGNHDQAILKILAGEMPDSRGAEREHHQWIAEHFDQYFMPYLEQIPQKTTAVYNGHSFLFTHYHLDENEKLLPVDYEPTVEKLEALYQESQADVVCFGHHHVLHHFKSHERVYFNPGSLGCQHKPLAPYAIVTVGEAGNIDVSLKEVPYDNKEFLMTYANLSIPAKEFVLKNFYGNQHLDYINEGK
jgi:putative phosphoesterase